MLQLILGYTFATLTGLLALILFVSAFVYARRGNTVETGQSVIMFIICAALSVLFAWATGV